MGRSITYTYDGQGRTTHVTDAEGSTVTEYTTTTHPTYGTVRKIAIRDKENSVTTKILDPLGRVIEIQQPDPFTGYAGGPSTKFTYTPHGQQELVTDPLGEETYYAYDDFNRLSVIGEKMQSEPIGAIAQVAAYDYYPDGTVYVDNLRAGHFGKGDRQIDRYFCRGGGEEIFEPHFTYHGFQFVEIHGLSRKPTAEEVTGIVFHTDFGKESTFNCSNPLLTRFIRNIKWSMRANIMGIPTDCNQRDERCGYTGDMNFFMPAALYNFDLASFFNKWLVDVEQAQNPEGWFPDHAPYYGPGGGPNVGWSD